MGTNNYAECIITIPAFAENRTYLSVVDNGEQWCDGHAVKNIPSLDYCETHGTPIPGHAAERLIVTGDSVQGLNFGSGNYGLRIQHENGNQCTTISHGDYGDRFYFPKKVNDGVVEDSAEGQWTLDAALHIAFCNGYSVVEERKGANADDPLSGELVYCHSV